MIHVASAAKKKIRSATSFCFAVAITLLVFSLQVPTLDNPLTSEHLVRMLLQRWPSYLAFFISFATIFIMWISHHAMFKLIDKSDLCCFPVWNLLRVL